jgi:hypothetical protein
MSRSKKGRVERPSARDRYFAGKISAEEYAKFVICNPAGDHALKESANKVKKIEEHLERQRAFA